ncbi:hypothetical protein LTR50_005343 [Elasticomyces elasticus]|nr:hypothetical protein LTR50_005343 [Elasticomyces elasticus]
MPPLEKSTSSSSPFTKAHDAVASYPICLVTGGSGYIGSHTVLELLGAGVAVVVLDNLVNSHMESLCRVYRIAEYERKLAGQENVPPLFFHCVDLRDKQAVIDVFAFWQEPTTASKAKPIDVAEVALRRTYSMKEYNLVLSKRPKPLPSTTDPTRHGKVTSVVHFAALKAVGESVSKPLEYYENNIGGLLNLLQAMKAHNVKEMVFSSSAVVYGAGKEANISEDAVQVGGKGPGAGLITNPYGRSKWMAEEILNDCCIADAELRVTSLRYFNPTGSHPSGLIGEDPKGTPNNIVPVILQAYQRRRSKVYIFGSGYDTQDGTGVRDYIHVSDLAKGHLAALRKIDPSATPPTVPGLTDSPQQDLPRYNVYNLGTGHGYSVLEILDAFSQACGVEIPFTISGPRTGDLGTVTASTKRAQTELEWEADFGIQDMCRDVYNWAEENPRGYEQLRRFSAAIASQDPEMLRRASIDPQALRNASVSAGLFKSEEDIGKFMKNVARTTRKESAFGEMMRKMSVMFTNESIPEDEGEDHESSGQTVAAPVVPPKWDVFGKTWQTDSIFSSRENPPLIEEPEDRDPLSSH